MKTTVSALLGALALGVSFASVASAADTSVCLITKTDTNPFFVKMKEGATAKAKELGVTLKSMPARSTAIPKARSPPSRPALPMAPRVS